MTPQVPRCRAFVEWRWSAIGCSWRSVVVGETTRPNTGSIRSTGRLEVGSQRGPSSSAYVVKIFCQREPRSWTQRANDLLEIELDAWEIRCAARGFLAVVELAGCSCWDDSQRRSRLGWRLGFARLIEKRGGASGRMSRRGILNQRQRPRPLTAAFARVVPRTDGQGP